MDDRPVAFESQPLMDSSQDYPPQEQRAVASEGEFKDETGAFQGAFEHAAIGMALADLEGRFLKVNRSVCRILGYCEAELLSMDFQSVTHPDDLQRNLVLTARLMRGEMDHYDLEKRCLHKQGHVIWVQFTVSMVRDSDQNARFLVSQVQDITARKQAEQDAARRLRHLERLTQTVSRILNALESTPDDTVYCDVLSILLDSFQSQTGVFLRFTEDDVLVGPYLSPIEKQDMRYKPGARCELWDTVLRTETALIENRQRWMVCDKLLSRSLVAPIRHAGVPLGVFHIGDAEADYDADDLDLLTRVSEMIAPVVHARMERAKLTPREAEVMDLIVSGKTQKQIAAELAFSIQTAARHRARVLEKLHVRNDVELVHRALRMRRPSA